VGHLGIFVSGGIARKEHSEFSSNIDLIDLLPPGLYEASFEPKSVNAANVDLVQGDWIMRCEPRTLDDIRALGGNTPEDERRFATAARVSDINLALYRTFLQPFVKATASSPATEWMHRLHPLRLSYEILSDSNPFMRAVAGWAPQVREQRQPAGDENLFVAAQEAVSKQTVAALNAWRDMRDQYSEWLFLSVYGSPLLQAAVGVDPTSTAPLRKAGKSALHREFVQKRLTELKSRIKAGGLQEAAVRALIYIGLARGRVDERGVEAVRRIRLMQEEQRRLTLAQFKAMAREQSFMLLVYPEEAVAAIADLLPDNADERRKAFAAIRQVLTASGELTGNAAARLSTIARLFGLEGDTEEKIIDLLKAS
jgi:hypothetical protein